LKKHYDKDELNLKNDSEEEQIRARGIFEDLRKKATEGKKILEREKDFFCTYLKLTNYEDDGDINDFVDCEDFIYRELYLTYFSSALADDEFYKADKGKIRKVEMKEQVKDFKYLQKERHKWLKVIENQKHKDQLLQMLTAETRNDLKKLKKSSGKLYFSRQKREYELQQDKHILHSRYIYLVVKQVIENANPADFEFQFAGEQIEIDAYSLIHIINRHYAETIKGDSNKTYHIEDFKPDEVHLMLRDILLRIDEKGLVQSADIRKIAFIYKGVTYRLWINKRKKFIKGTGETESYRLDTFYPIEDVDELKDIADNYNSVNIDAEIEVYVRK
jgi:hypothetical protein